MGGQILKFASRMNRSAWLMLALILACVSSAFAQLPANVFVNSRRYNFAYQTGTNIAPQAQTLQVISETPKNFTVSTQLVDPTNVSNWVTVNGTSATTGTTGQPSSFVTVGANPWAWRLVFIRL